MTTCVNWYPAILLRVSLFNWHVNVMIDKTRKLALSGLNSELAIYSDVLYLRFKHSRKLPHFDLPYYVVPLQDLKYLLRIVVFPVYHM